MTGLPSDALDVLQRLSASNEGRLPDKLALLERRLTVPPSPVVSHEGAGSLLLNQNSVHSVTQQSGLAGRHATPSISNTADPPGALEPGAASRDGIEATSQHPSKRRRVGQPAGPGLKPPAAAARGASVSAPAQQQQQRLSPFLAETNSRQGAQQPTPSSSKKQKNTIARYFPQLSGGGGAVAGGGDGTTAAKHRASSPAASDPAAPAAAAALQTLQAEALRLR